MISAARVLYLTIGTYPTGDIIVGINMRKVETRGYLATHFFPSVKSY